MKVLALRRPDSCVSCQAPLAAGERALWDASTKTVRCLTCAPPLQESVPVPAKHNTSYDADSVLPSRTPPAASAPVVHSAGASAQREHDRRSARREERIRSAHPRLGGLLLALSNDPVSTRVWAQGAYGERVVAAKIDELVGEHVVALHDRKMLRTDGKASRANIDHLVVAASGVWVVDAKTHTGTLEVRRSGGLFSPKVEALYIRGRDQTKLVHGLLRQVDVVRDVLASVKADVAVRGALCFVGTELPWFGNSIVDVPLVGRRGLAKILKQEGPFGLEDRADIAAYLSSTFVPA